MLIKKMESVLLLAYCVPVMITLKLKVVKLPALDDAVSVRSAAIELLVFNK